MPLHATRCRAIMEGWCRARLATTPRVWYNADCVVAGGLGRRSLASTLQAMLHTGRSSHPPGRILNGMSTPDLRRNAAGRGIE